MAKKPTYLDLIKKAQSKPGVGTIDKPSEPIQVTGKPQTEAEIDESLAKLESMFKEIQARRFFYQKRIQWAASRFNEGHYLDRAIAVAEVCELSPTMITMLQLQKTFEEERGSAAPWIHLMIHEVSLEAIHKMQKDVGLADEWMKPMAWALDFGALCQSNLQWLRDKDGVNV